MATVLKKQNSGLTDFDLDSLPPHSKPTYSKLCNIIDEKKNAVKNEHYELSAKLPDEELKVAKSIKSG